MTREELRDYVELQRSLNNIPYHVYSALIDGIDTLEQEPTTKNNLAVDCISRKQAIERLELNFPISAGADNSKERYRYMQALADTQAIREMPPATLQEPRKGHWTCDRANVRCSCCSKGYKDFYGKARIASYNYCPNCGAKMESENQE